MQPTSSSTKYIRAVKTVLLFISGIALAGVVLFVIDTRLRVKTITLEGVNKGQTIYGLESLYREKIYALQEKAAADAIKKNNPGIASAVITKQYPDTLRIKISFYRPAAYLKADSGYLLLSADGRVLERIKDGKMEDVPVISYYEKISYDSIQPGSFFSMRDILTAIFFAEKVKAVGLHVITIDIDGVDMIGLNLDGKVIDFSSEKDRDLQVYQMEQIVHQFRIDGKNFVKMDLRFNQPILELIQ